MIGGRYLLPADISHLLMILVSAVFLSLTSGEHSVSYNTINYHLFTTISR